MNRLRKAVESNNGRTLLGAALYFYDPVFLEIAAHLGYQAILIEMEHAPISFADAADLAASLGHPGQTLHPSVRDAATQIVQAARANNKCIASACGPADFKFWIDQKIDLLFCTNDIACLKRGASLALQEAKSLLNSNHVRSSARNAGTTADAEKVGARNGVGIA